MLDSLENDVDFYEDEDAQLRAVIERVITIMRQMGAEISGNVIYFRDQPDEEDDWDETDYDYDEDNFDNTPEGYDPDHYDPMYEPDPDEKTYHPMIDGGTDSDDGEEIPF